MLEHPMALPQPDNHIRDNGLESADFRLPQALHIEFVVHDAARFSRLYRVVHFISLARVPLRWPWQPMSKAQAIGVLAWRYCCQLGLAGEMSNARDDTRALNAKLCGCPLA